MPFSADQGRQWGIAVEMDSKRSRRDAASGRSVASPLPSYLSAVPGHRLYAHKVITAPMTVRIALWLKGSDCTIRTGRRYLGFDALGAGSLAHQISLCLITTVRTE
jgi:hypothetical protein